MGQQQQQLLLLGAITLLLPSCAASPPDTLLWDGAALLATRVQARGSAPTPTVRAAVSRLRADAHRLSSQGPWSVMDKPLTPASGDKHDYMSVGSYWWPCTALCNRSLFPKPGECQKWTKSDLGPQGPPFKNCSSATGLPWYDHDGYHNPLSDQTDPPQKGAMAAAVRTLTLSGFYGGNEVHANRSALLLRTWFLDSRTRMNPNARFAQGIPGKCDGRGIGLIDFATDFPMLLDCIVILGWLGALTRTDMAALHGWWTEWLEWVWSSPNGRDERAATNNHGTNYDKHVVAVAHFVRNASVVAAVCSAAPARRLDVQIGANGTLPMEDRRTKSEGYHTYDAIALLELAAVCRKSYGTLFPGGDRDYLYHYRRAADAVGLIDVVEWLLPFARSPGGRPWPFAQILPFDRSEWSKLFRLAANAPAWAGETARRFEAVAEQQPGYLANSSSSSSSSLLLALTYPPSTQPLPLA